jgi:type I restriction enzyme R subunit
VSLEVMLRGVCDPVRLLDIVENFTLFSEEQSGLAKIVAQNHQVLGVNAAIPAMLAARAAGHGRGGVFWHTQGAGKSLSMVFFAQKVLRTVEGNWTFVVVTDRQELDEQIAKTFKATGAVSAAESKVSHAGSGHELRALLRGNHRYVFTLVHKFQTPELLCDRPDVIVLTDEAHRSQYDTLALNMRAALPHAMFVAFTGTPLIAGEERTREVFGDYVSVYDFQQSVQDHATVPLFYENRTPELRLENPDLNDDIYALVEAADLDEDQEKRLERELGRQYHLLTRDDRLDTVAKDVVHHFLGRGFQGKAMVVSIDKATALRMYDKVRAQWNAERVRVEKELARLLAYSVRAEPDAVRELQQRLETLVTTDMALIVSPGQNEIEGMKRRPRHRAASRADERRRSRRAVQGFKGSAAPRFSLRDVAHRLRRAELPDGVSRQADAQPHADADHRTREPRVSRKARRPDRRLRERFRVAREGFGDLRDRPGGCDAGPEQGGARWRVARCRRRSVNILRGTWRGPG